MHPSSFGIAQCNILPSSTSFNLHPSSTVNSQISLSLSLYTFQPSDRVQWTDRMRRCTKHPNSFSPSLPSGPKLIPLFTTFSPSSSLISRSSLLPFAYHIVVVICTAVKSQLKENCLLALFTYDFSTPQSSRLFPYAQCVACSNELNRFVYSPTSSSRSPVPGVRCATWPSENLNSE